MSASQRRKGHDWEREVARRLREALPNETIRRGQQGGGAVEPDVILPGWWIECKRGKRTRIKAAIGQAMADEAWTRRHSPRRVPVAVCRDDGDGGLVVMTISDWIDIVAELDRWRRG